MLPHDDVAATANEKLDRIIALLEQIAGQRTAPPPSPDNARAFLDGLRGKTIDEIRAANRERNKRLRTAQ